MPPKKREIAKLEWMPEGKNFCIVFPPEKPGDLPNAHIFQPMALIARSHEHDYDPEAPDWEWRVVTHILHEQHTPAPDHAKKREGYALGVVQDAAVADEVIEWGLTEEHLDTVRAVFGGKKNAKRHLQAYRARVAPERESPPDDGHVPA